MSNLVFPTLPGLDWNGSRTVLAPPVQVRTTPSQREFRARDATIPRYRYNLSYEFLRAGSRTEWQTLEGFFKLHGGDFESFLYLDPDDNAATSMTFGLGNGSTTAFQLTRSLGGFAEPVADVSGTPQVFVNDWQNVTLASTVARTNLLQWSEDLTNAVWTKDNVTLLNNNNTGPDGTVTADQMVENSATGTHRVYQVATVPSATGDLTFSSFFVRAGRGPAYLHMIEQTGFSDAYAFFNLSFGATGSTVGATVVNGNWSNLRVSIVPVSAGWYRAQITATKNNAATAVACIAGGAAVDGTLAYTGAGVALNDPWGLQLERASSATRYIKTAGATGTVTDYALSATGLVTFAVPPLAGAPLTWTGNFYRRCRFERGEQEFREFMQDYWEAKSVRLLSVKPGSQ